MNQASSDSGVRNKALLIEIFSLQVEELERTASDKFEEVDRLFEERLGITLEEMVRLVRSNKSQIDVEAIVEGMVGGAVAVSQMGAAPREH